MDTGTCRKLDLPFVGNQADFLFTKACAICDKEADLLGNGNTRNELGGAAEPPPVTPPNITLSWPHPRRNTFRWGVDWNRAMLCDQHRWCSSLKLGFCVGLRAR